MKIIDCIFLNLAQDERDNQRSKAVQDSSKILLSYHSLDHHGGFL